jgi:ribosomal protein L22
MSPENPQDPQKGKAADTSAEDAAAAKEAVVETPAQPEPEASEGGTPSAASADEVGRADERSEAGTAAETTGVDKAAADALADAQDQEPQAASGDDDPAASEDAVAEPEETADEEPPAEAVAEEAPEDDANAEEATDDDANAEAAPAKPKRRARAKKGAAEEPAESAEEPAKPRRGRGRKTEEETPIPVGIKVSAQAKYVRTSARKARLVCDHIRGKDVQEARAILAFTPRGAAKAWSKLLESAVANAEHNHELVGEELRIFNVHADEGPTLKRYRPRAMGRATRIRKRTSHLSITLTPKEL